MLRASRASSRDAGAPCAPRTSVDYTRAFVFAAVFERSANARGSDLFCNPAIRQFFSATLDPRIGTPSATSSARFRASWPPYPPSRPPAAITRWHGTSRRPQSRMMLPTARAARGLPARAATSPYVATRPGGMRRTIDSTRAVKSLAISTENATTVGTCHLCALRGGAFATPHGAAVYNNISGSIPSSAGSIGFTTFEGWPSSLSPSQRLV